VAGDVEVLVRLGLAHDAATDLPRLPAERVAPANARRRALLRRIAGGGGFAHKGTKPHLGPLSPGCVRCGERAWSCMFLNHFCNGGCFFCPDAMDSQGAPPFAERFVFRSPDAYARYVERLGFRGVSFSGGDPFLALDSLVAHVDAVRDRLGDRAYVWVYTNGSAARGARLERIAAGGGVDELRFNIAAWDYDLAAVAAAVDTGLRVTVEIPAVPEDRARLARLLPELARLGVAHLNLHQLMVLGANGPALRARPYSFTTSAVPAVIESELCALELMAFAVAEGVPLPINYCGLIYKERWQNATLELRAATLVAQPCEEVVETGLLRRLWLPGDGAAAATLVARAAASGEPAARWRRDPESDALCAHPALLRHLDAPVADAFVTYHRCLLLGAADGVEDDGAAATHPCHEVDLGPGGRLVVMVVPASPPIPLDVGAARALRAGDTPAALLAWEQVRFGLPDYA
jgi:pyruvate formate-lyase activating enzyme-like uncharacterized protein